MDPIERALSLVDEVLAVDISVSQESLREDWPKVAYFHWISSRDALRALRLTASEELYGPSMVLLRHILELAAVNRYISLDVENRLPSYLDHYRPSLGNENIEELDAQLAGLWENEDLAGIAKLLVPSSSWKQAREIFEACGWTEEFAITYRIASEKAHGGAHGMETSARQHLGEQAVDGFEIANILRDALRFYASLVEIGGEVLPEIMLSLMQIGEKWTNDVREFDSALSDNVQSAVWSSAAE